MKRIWTIAPLLLIAAAASLAINARNDSATASSNRTDRTIRLSLVKGPFHAVDQPPAGNSVGDEGIFAGKLVKHGHTRGRVQAYCLVMPSNRQECTFTYALARGQIASVVGYGKGLSGNSGNHLSHDPIVGGSRAYAGATGQIVGREVGPKRDRLVFHLLG